ncbi:MAG: DUF5131 family protein [Candidatus Edwardsbacteria bacterium]|nr:DUF5131 family protein [Candidatus Edwardsbacteria bacterium]
MKNKPSLWWNLSINPWFGCSSCSPGCIHCWAAASFWDEKADRPLPGREDLVCRDPRFRNIRWTGQIQLNPNYDRQLAQLHCLPSGSRVAVEFMGDLFYDHPLCQDRRDHVLQLAQLHPDLVFILTTKRVHRIKDIWPGLFYDLKHRHPNIWLLASVSNQKELINAACALSHIKAAVVGISAEPLLEALYLREFISGLDWVILGAERCRPFKLARRFYDRWAFQIMEDCLAAGKPLFYKYGQDETGRFCEAPVINGRFWLQYPIITPQGGE